MAWGDCQGGHEGCLPFCSPIQRRHPRIAAEHLQALPHPSSACSSPPKPVSRGFCGSGTIPRDSSYSCPLYHAPSRAEVQSGAGMDGSEGRGAQRGLPSAVSGPARCPGWLCREVALFSG